jgi:hypothetical protein
MLLEGGKMTAEKIPTVFVPGYAGYGQYDKMNETFHYWGMSSGDLVGYLNAQGFESYAASVDPVGSAWDRACELYAQMTGTVVDYGKVHSSMYKHKRFGMDYSANPLITGWGEQDTGGVAKKVNFIGHSFGGTTVRQLAELLAYGSVREMKGTEPDDLSDLFRGGKKDWIHSITTLASPHNGTTMTNLSKPVSFLLPKDGEKIVGVTGEHSIAIAGYLKNLAKLFKNGIGEDTGVYDLSLDGAARLNSRLSTFCDIYYFSFPTDSTTSVLHTGNRAPNVKLTDVVLWPTCTFLGIDKGKTPGGIVYDNSWLNNDGIVNTISTTAPGNAPQKAFDANDVSPGIWHVMPVFKGDHMSITGGLTRAVDVKAFYTAQMNLVGSL